MFVDEVDIEIAAGDGGNGCSSFRREKFVPRGGPDGGDGGRGGSVYLRASSHHNTLINYRYKSVFRAPRGAHGQGTNRSGRAGDDLTLEVPVGTIIFESGDPDVTKLADLAEVGDEVVVAQGGRGGRGNQNFATSTDRAPRRADRGEPGETKRLTLSLKLLADIGLVGFPNVGKSTLISRLSAARPKIADYPFTTLTPHLGMVKLDDDRSLVLADVPGLIPGAHDGHGLGLDFLSHLERTKVLVHVVDVSSASGRDPVADYEIIRHELASYQVSPAEAVHLPLTEKCQLVAANKIDALDDRERLERLSQRLGADSIPLYPISAISGEGLNALREAMWRALEGTAT